MRQPIFALALCFLPVFAQAEQAPQVGGDYICSIVCNCGQVTRDPEIIQDQSGFHFVNECGMQAAGSYVGSRTINIASWHTDAVVDSDLTTVRFKNGTIWKRK